MSCWGCWGPWSLLWSAVGVQSWGMGYVLGIIAVWGLVGLLIALIYRRSGHNLIVFATLGLVLGPLTILLFGDLRDADDTPPLIVRRGRDAPGPGLRMLVAVDEHPEGTQSAVAAARMAAPAAGSLSIVTVVDYETARAPRPADEPAPRQAHLEETAIACGAPDAELVVLAGRTDRALVRYATTVDADLLVVSSRRHHLSAILLGSTVARLARRAGVALLIGPPLETPVGTGATSTRAGHGPVRTLGRPA